MLMNLKDEKMGKKQTYDDKIRPIRQQNKCDIEKICWEGKSMGTQQVRSFAGGEDKDSTRDNEVSDNDGRKSNK